MSSASASAPARKALRILVVENKKTDGKLIRSVLERSGHEVFLVGSAEEALRTMAATGASTIDAVVTDLDLPGVDGVTLGRKKETAAIPVIAVTSYPEHFPDTAASRACFAAYVVKPINTRSLAHTVAAAVAKK
jgi:CheY-like chemotaxis protein